MSNFINSSSNFGLAQSIRASIAQEIRFETIANNISNVETPGFKSNNLSFDNLLNEVITTDYRQGHLKHTGNPLDVGLQGGDFFKIQTPQGIRYSRNGTFTISSQGQLVTQNGDPVLGRNGPITIPEGGDITIDEFGGVWVGNNQVDTLSVVDFGGVDKESDWVFGAEGATFGKLRKEGNSYYRLMDESINVVDSQTPKVHQGFLEQSNVSVMSEMVKMIETHRNFEAYHRIIQTFIETDQKATTQVGKLQ